MDRLGKFFVKLIIFLSAFLILLLSLNLAAQDIPDHSAAGNAEDKVPAYAPGEVLVKFKEGVNPGQVLQEIEIEAKGIERVHPIQPAVAKFKKDYKLEKDSDGWYPFLGRNYKELSDIPDEEVFKEAYSKMPEVEKALYRSYKIRLPEGASVEAAVAKLKNNPDVEYAEPNYISRTFYVPDDPLYPQQWSHAKTQAPLGWDVQRGDPGVVVAIVDTGVAYTHEDLATNIWRDSEGNPGRDFVDIDTAEYIAEGYQLITGEDYTTPDDDPADYDGHGTHCAGIAGAVGNNGIGVAGVAHTCKVMPVRAGFSIKFGGSTYGMFEYDDIANAIVYAIDHGAHVISMSFGGPKSSAIEDVIHYAHAQRVILVAAAGNDADYAKQYPAGYDDVIAVGATDKNDSQATFSNFGSWVAVAAPGAEILSTVPSIGVLSDPSGYRSLSGTSMACPYVAGLVVLLKSKNADYDLSDIKRALYRGADTLGPEYVYGYGRVNIYKTLRDDPVPYLIARITDPEKMITYWGYTVSYQECSKSVTIRGTALSDTFSSYSIEAGQGSNPTAWTTSGISLCNDGNAQIVDDSMGTWDISSLSDGVYTLRLMVYSASGSTAESKVSVYVNNAIRAGWPQDTLLGCASYVDSPVMADIDADGGLEIIASSYEGLVYVWHQDGALAKGWPVYIGGQAITPAVADLDRDGYMEIVVGNNSPNKPEHLFVFRYDGSLYPGAWPKGWGTEYNWEINFISDAPTLYDIDGDGDLEIFVGNENRKLCAWHHTGERLNGWPVSVMYSQNVSTPAVGDIDGDKEPEVVTVEAATFGTNVYGYVYAWNPDGTPVSGLWPVNVEGSLYQPAIGDIDGDNELEIIVNARGGLFAFKGNGTLVPGWPKVSGTGFKQVGDGIPSLGDLDGDGVPEVILAGTESTRWTGSGYAPTKVQVFKGDGTTFGNWPYVLSDNFYNPAQTYGASVADVDGDGRQEVLTALYDSYYGRKYLYILRGDGTLFPGYPRQFDIAHMSIPALGDVEGNRTLQLAAFCGADRTFPAPFYVYDMWAESADRKLDWPMFGRDPQHTGCYPVPNRPPVLLPIGDKTVNEGELLQFTIVATDPNKDTLTYGARGLPEGAAMSDETFSWTPAYEQAGTYQVTFTVSDAEFTVSQTITITANNVNRPPVFSPIGNKEVREGQMLFFTVSATDPDGDPLTYAAKDLPVGARFNPQMRVCTWVSTYTQAGTYTVTFTVSDGALTGEASVTITVINVNLPPTCRIVAAPYPKDPHTYVFTATARDPDGSIARYCWNMGDTTTMSGAQFQYRYKKAGIYIVRLIVEDNEGMRSKPAMTVVVVPHRRVLPFLPAPRGYK